MRVIVFILILLAAPSLAAQALPYEAERQVHWATAAFFGTGWYRVSESREMFIFRVPPRQVLREPAWSGDGEREIGIEIHYPLAFGLHSLDDIPDFVDFDNYGTVTFTPGVTLEIPVSERWRLRPYAHFGVGYERQSGEWARIAYGGVRSRYRLFEHDGRGLALLGGLSMAAHRPAAKGSGHYASAMIGLEGRRRAGDLQIAGAPAWFNWHLTYSYLFDQLQFYTGPGEVITVRDEWDIGLALARDGGPIRIGFLSFEQIGLSWRWSSNREFRAITVSLRSPFSE